MIENKEPFLIDTNILVYAYGKVDDIKKHEKAKQFIGLKMHSEKFFLSSQNVAEFFSVLSNQVSSKMPAYEAKQKAKNLTELANFVSYYEDTVIEAIEIFEKHKGHFWDALLAATMKENNIKIIYTENVKDFSKIDGIKAINPLD
ncbi:MAG: PIN domain-containing protein [archaeon]|nr:PIN domain-containing protein [archaeon]